MKSSRSRSRSKSNRNRSNNSSGGNIVNRVFDSNGPEGKVRGTPQQIIEKYNQLARDAQLSNDRVAAENFQQHAEHYTRLLSEAQREIDNRREEQERQNRERQAERDRERAERQEREAAQQQEREAAQQKNAGPSEFAEPSQSDDEGGESNLVETPESQPKKQRAPRRKPRQKAEQPAETSGGQGGDGGDAPKAAE
ncbi:DUF4167 domain-containing protein [Sulfitobacter sp. D35]|uniref:DUF4167 domain-containing protein n=1 Tax=Sulfitobacter sp. D35 TaxID=3083252 RepID=UPI00296F55BA|nr:DUF4167 domain-containing protein [Sulfitobacter sp. D35]MDW4497620.1 DUF4167 domain-containing protein [Sulfitobacter sp. D35]